MFSYDLRRNPIDFLVKSQGHSSSLIFLQSGICFFRPALVVFYHFKKMSHIQVKSSRSVLTNFAGCMLNFE